jgi:hypothetical protein
MSLPHYYDIALIQGDTVRFQFLYEAAGVPFNLTGTTAALQVRTFAGADRPRISLTVGNGIELGGPSGTIDVILPGALTRTLSATTHVYALELTSANGDTTNFATGSIAVRTDVAR